MAVCPVESYRGGQCPDVERTSPKCWVPSENLDLAEKQVTDLDVSLANRFMVEQL